MSTARPYVHPDMTPQEAAWEPRQVALPRWLWDALEHEVDSHKDCQGCSVATVDMALASHLCRRYTDPSQDSDQAYELETHLLGVDFSHVTAPDGTMQINDLSTLAAFLQVLSHGLRPLVAVCDDNVLAHAIGQLSLELHLAHGGRLGDNDLLHRWYLHRRRMSPGSQLFALAALGADPEMMAELRRRVGEEE